MEELEKLMWLEDKPCKAMREKLYLKGHWEGDLPGLAPIGKCYFVHSKDCNEKCPYYEEEVKE